MALNSTVKTVAIVAAVAVIGGGVVFGIKKFADGDSAPAPQAQIQTNGDTAGFDQGAAPGQKPKANAMIWPSSGSNSDSSAQNASNVPQSDVAQAPAPQAQTQQAASPREQEPAAQSTQMATPAPAQVPPNAPTQAQASDSAQSNDSAIDAMSRMKSLNLGNKNNGH